MYWKLKISLERSWEIEEMMNEIDGLTNVGTYKIREGWNEGAIIFCLY